MCAATSYTKLDVDLRHAGLDLCIKASIPLNKGIVGVFGPSGHGKSTLLKMIAGLQESDLADCFFVDEKGFRLTQTNKNKHRAMLSPIVYQEQSATLFECMTVQQNLEFIQQHSSWSKHAQFSYSQVVAWCDISELLPKAVQVLSGGEKQRVAFARSLLSGKPILFLDEPFSALDWSSRRHFMALIKQLYADFSLKICLVSHSLKELAICSDYLLHINQGKLEDAGLTKDLMGDLTVRQSVGVFSRLQLTFDSFFSSMNLAKWRLINDESAFIYTSETLKPVSSKMTVTLDADKVSLAKEAPSATSMLNHLVGVIEDIQPHQHLKLVTVNVANQKVYALISKLSFEQLALVVGDEVQVLFKAI